MRLKSLARAAGALVGLAVAAAVVFMALLTVLVRLGVPQWAASPAAISAVVAPALGAADAFTPLGNTRRMDALRAKADRVLALDFVFAGAVGGVVGLAGAYVLLSPDAAGLTKTVVVSAAILLGYGTFVARNLDVYGGGVPVPAGNQP